MFEKFSGQMSNSYDIFMQEALHEAQLALEKGEVPIGAVVVSGGEIIARAHNEVESRNDASAHAEMLAMQRASEKLKNWRLQSCSLYVTLEPCTMCIGGMILSRVDNLIYAVEDPRQGAAGSIYDLSEHSQLPHEIKVVSGVLAKESSKLLKQFFENIRQK